MKDPSFQLTSAFPKHERRGLKACAEETRSQGLSAEEQALHAALLRVNQLSIELSQTRAALGLAEAQSLAPSRTEPDMPPAGEHRFRAGHHGRGDACHNLFEKTAEGILILDPLTQKITSCNPVILDLLECSCGEIIGRELWEIGLLKDQDAAGRLFRRLHEESFVRSGDLMLHPGGENAVEIEFAASLNHEQGPALIQCSVRDISARKRSERALAAAAEAAARHSVSLEALVEERTARLRETLGELEMFSYAMAHDMRAPLRAMEGFAQILLEDYGATLPPEARAYIERITSAAGRMDMLIQDVLAYTNLLNSEIRISGVDLGFLTRQVIMNYPELSAPGVTIQIDGELPAVLAHPAALAQCIANILCNAVKFARPATPPVIRISATVSATDVRLSIQDNGIGIDPHEHKRIFGIFERVSNAHEGTGIGLAIVAKNIKRLSGRVGVESSLGKGSNFWLELKKA